MSALNTSGKFPKVLGYISETERIALQRCILATWSIPGDALEIGSLNGLSALLILSVLESSKSMICIEKGQVETLSENLIAYGHSEQAIIVNNDFTMLPEFKPDMKLSFVFIDHSHTYGDNIAAFDKFWPHVSSGGILAFHDYKDPNWEDGTRAIDDLIAAHALTPEPYLCGGSFIAFKKG